MRQHIRILIAARDERLQIRLERLLMTYDRLMIVQVKDGESAVRRALALEPDILILDPVLTGMDGLGVYDTLRQRMGSMMPKVIAGNGVPHAARGFEQRGVRCVPSCPWQDDVLARAVNEAIRSCNEQIDWAAVQEHLAAARDLLEGMGVKGSLRGCMFLSWCAAVAMQHPQRLEHVRKELYEPVAQKLETTPENVERQIRHAVERTVDTMGAEALYTNFGNTLDPECGKPSNTQMIGQVAERLRARRR